MNKGNLLILDQVSFKPQIMINGRERASNYYGLIYSILTFLTSLSFGIYFLKESTDRKKSFLSSSETFIGKQEYILDNFTMIFDIRDGYAKSIPDFDKLITIEESYKKTIPENYGYANKENECEQHERGINYSTYYTGNFKCGNEEFKPPLHRYGGGNIYTITFHLCKNSTTQTCFDYETILEKLKSTSMYLYVLFKDKNVKHNETENIFETISNGAIFRLSTSLFMRYQLKYQPIYYNVDVGYIFEDFKHYNGYKYTGYDYQIDIIKYKPGVKIGQLELTLDSNIKTFNRSYIKLQEVAARIGGVIEFFLLGGIILLYLYSKNLFLYEFANKLFFKEDTECLKLQELNNNMDKNKIQQTNIKENHLQQNRILLNQKIFHYENTTEKEEITKPILQLLKSKRNQDENLKGQKKEEQKVVTFTWKDYFNCHSKQTSLIENRVNELMSYDNILNLMIELNDLKNYIYLNNNLIYFGNGISIEDLKSQKQIPKDFVKLVGNKESSQINQLKINESNTKMNMLWMDN